MKMCESQKTLRVSQEAIHSYIGAADAYRLVAAREGHLLANCHYHLALCYELLDWRWLFCDRSRTFKIRRRTPRCVKTGVFRTSHAQGSAQQTTCSSASEWTTNSQNGAASAREFWSVRRLLGRIQMNKARSLSDLLGMGSIVPSFLLEKIHMNPAISNLFGEESRLVQNLYKAEPYMRFQEHNQLEHHRRRMAEYPVLNELQGLWEELSETLESLDWLFSDNEERHAIIIDWICLDKQVLVVIMDHEWKPVIIDLNFNTESLNSSVSAWLTDSLKLPYDGESSPLDRLIYPLDDYTESGDLLILSPSGVLHSFPLHALSLPHGWILIEWNHIVYSSNLSILHQCFIRSNTSDRKMGHQCLMMGVYEDRGEEPKKVYTDLSHQAHVFGRG